LLKLIHQKIEERYKDYRLAFRNFDKNFDGGVNFKEFVNGMENMGVSLHLEDFRRIFLALDTNNDGEITFVKFCLLNADLSVK
jgi:Ca2+-binding EF-hand superfamily protein